MLWYPFLLYLTAVSALFVGPLTPNKDPFYTTPKNISLYKNGDIIGYRPTPAQIRSVLFPINVKSSWQLLVRSEDSHGKPNAIVSTILEPYNANPDILVSYQPMQDSSSNDCSPSYSFLFNANPDTIIVQSEMLLIETALAKGWFVVVPDYEGFQGAFTAGKQSGQATLNSLRAALKTKSFTGISPKAKTAFWGYSGGTIASGWAAALQPTYAPELTGQLVGCAVGGWVTNITLTALVTSGTVFAGLVPNAINGLISEYPNLRPIVEREFRWTTLRSLFAAKEKCLFTSIFDYALAPIFNGPFSWAKKGAGFFNVPEIKAVVLENTAALNREGPMPQIPMFVFHGTEDEVVPFSGAQRAYDNYCSWGIKSMEFAVSSSTGHLLELVEGSGAAITWLQKRFNGEQPVQGCQRTVRKTNTLYPGAEAQYRQLVLTLYSSVFQQPIGETTRNTDSSTLVSRVLVKIFANLIKKIGPIPLKRDLEYDHDAFRGLSDVFKLWEDEHIDPFTEIQVNVTANALPSI